MMRLAHRSCGFETVQFLDETETHVVVSGLHLGQDDDEEEEEEDQHACLVGLVAFVAAHPDVLSVQMRARYGSHNAEASWIIQVSRWLRAVCPSPPSVGRCACQPTQP